jgi:hypothetical protein
MNSRNFLPAFLSAAWLAGACDVSAPETTEATDSEFHRGHSRGADAGPGPGPGPADAGTDSGTASVDSGSSGSSGASGIYAPWANYPQDPSFFPIAIWNQKPTKAQGPGSPFATNADAMAALKINVLVTIDGGNNGGGYPAAFGQDSGGAFAALVKHGIYAILAADTSGNTSATSVASLQTMAANVGGTKYLIGYDLGDEPQQDCTLVSQVPTITQRVTSYDDTRPTIWNDTDFFTSHGICPDNVAAFQAPSIGMFDLYPVTSPWNAGNIPRVAGVAQDSMWLQGYSMARAVATGRPNQPLWTWVEVGTDELGFSEQAGSTCDASTNLCSPGLNEYRATAEQVNAEVWMSLINGATGIGYFCDDMKGYDFCLGNNQGGDGATALSIASNLTYVGTTIASFATALNAPLLAMCTMNTGPNYTDHTSSCTNGILTMSTSASGVPGSAMARSLGGSLFLFADPERKGSATMTFTLNGYAGKTATVVYDANDHYDPSNSSKGKTFTLNAAGQFSDTLGANGHDYQPKIYEIR